MNMCNHEAFGIAVNQLGLNPDEKVIVALSGGLDSMVLLFLAKNYFPEVIAAHCNFNLRAEESVEDQKFIEDICANWKIPCFIKQFDTKNFAEENKLSTQEAARNLRYSWFEELRLETSASAILTAHHKDDSIETFFINLMRGSGIKGLSGIPRINNNIKRPLFNFTKADLKEFALENQIPFREDSSNAEDKYLRNRIRHHLIPKITEIDKEALDRIAGSIDYLRVSNDFIERQAQNFIEYKFLKNENDYSIGLNNWKELAAEPALFFSVLSHFHFTRGEIEELDFIKNSQSGKKLISNKYTALKDRDRILLTLNSKTLTDKEFIIREEEGSLEEPLRMSWSKPDPNIPFPSDSYSAVLDANKLKFPLILRKWKPGDKFIPLGMKGRKKVSDFLIDQKVPLSQKENVFVLLSENKIAWIVGYRIDERFKTGADTKQVIVFKLL